MISISDWAQRHAITPEALRDLQRVLSAPCDIAPQPGAKGSEGSGQQRIRLEAPKHGVRYWRNNVGVAQREDGTPIRYGLANESKKMNSEIKSSDLIGVTPLRITAEHIGATLGVFTAIECKKPGWQYKGTKREVAQLAYMDLVISLGGFAQFATGPEDIWKSR